MSRKIAGISGLASQVVIIAVLLTVIKKSSWFSWTDNYISDFGSRGSLAVFFNLGLVITGVFSTVFTAGLRRHLRLSRVGMRGMNSLVLGSLGIIAAGVLPKTLDIPHDIASSISIIFIILGMLLAGAAIITASHVKLGLFSLAMGAFPIIFWLIPWRWGGDAITQMFYFASWSLWTLVFSFVLLRGEAPALVPDLFEITPALDAE